MWLSGLRPEARAMARVTHPAVAQIHGVESWRGRPFLVVEFPAPRTARRNEPPLPSWHPVPARRQRVEGGGLTGCPD